MKTMTGIDIEDASIEDSPRPSSRWEERNARRMESKRIATEAAHARARRNSKTLVERVEIAKARLAGANVPQTLQLIQATSSSDLDIYLLAEQFGENRRGVLKQFGQPRNSVRTAYLAEAGLASPEDAPDEGAKE
ncbi:MAG: hypothetical protein V4510_12970 [bacterium]